MKNYNCIVVLGTTASGKTRLACDLAWHLNGEVISADSRQVYQFLDIGTGKDLNEYVVNGKKIPHYLISIVHPNEQFYLHQFIEELDKAFHEIHSRHNLPIICGGTGLYLDALRKDFSLTQIKEDALLRKELENFSKEELLARLKTYPAELTKQVDLHSKKRITRGIEIAEYFKLYETRPKATELLYQPYYIGIQADPETRKKSITDRLALRLDNGLIEEVQRLLDRGIPAERLELLGLEYKFVLHFLQQKISREELFTRLQTAIFQFAKRQMTWFRKMEKEGVIIHWIDKATDTNALIKKLQEQLNDPGSK